MHRQNLQNRWSGQEIRIEKLISALKAGDDWTKFLGAFEANGVAYGPLQFITPWRTERGDLRGIPLQNVDLSRVQIEGADLEFAVFFKVTLSGASVSSLNKVTNLGSASFVHCRFEHAQFQGANCTNAHFGHCDFSEADFSGATLNSATLRSSIFRGANLAGTSLQNVNFVYSDLRQVSVSEKTAFGSLWPSTSSVYRIRLDDEAQNLSFDRFQFANQGEAFEGAAKVYEQLSDAYDRREIAAISKLWSKRARECLRYAANYQHEQSNPFQ